MSFNYSPIYSYRSIRIRRFVRCCRQLQSVSDLFSEMVLNSVMRIQMLNAALDSKQSDTVKRADELTHNCITSTAHLIYIR